MVDDVVLIAHEVEKARDFVFRVLLTKEQAEENQLVKVVLVNFSIFTRRLNLEEVDLLKHLLHCTALHLAKA